ncbi:MULTISPECIES: cytochrome b/b6 domain-containing protein [unclassified Neisseria]|uniref:cytochrome b/b6 domain-containing protein n=1 Tax=unclassified Neisseria TaxID=2623750 RepID=UPI0026655B8D|nr:MULTISPECIES: cytochrome b/b6 domain-containing protein [unclassified Neisseria]MDO1509128.1 cytochrome b/b6 domain-containing protein [Neisseria sp. MVDL19-042950]MDO1516777.1 cytochrome b/b6 domain-containing protein [Neisseria sp. MVDL18-041461]MDO1564011.1 cytochrome b/b6 domain-containing protein [Neisseria sp. MVDL20-010259]
MKQKLKVWDLPTRIFHWTLVLAIAFMWYSAETGGNMLLWHLRVGLLILGLAVFRVCWGLWGSDTSRFAGFVRGPAQIKRYIRGEITENEQPGHNPLGALMVLALLGAVLFQVTTGLFSPDENTFDNNGYLNALISEDTGSAIRKIHITFFNILLGLAAVHVATILLYRFVKKHNLITPMITGYKYLEGKLPVLKFAGAGKFIAAVAVAAAVVWVVLGLS